MVIVEKMMRLLYIFWYISSNLPYMYFIYSIQIAGILVIQQVNSQRVLSSKHFNIIRRSKR